MLDENDESPMFTAMTYSAMVVENSRGGVFVVSTQASEKQERNYVYLPMYVCEGKG